MSPPMVKRRYRHPWLCACMHGGGDVIPKSYFKDGVGQEKLPISSHVICEENLSFGQREEWGRTNKTCDELAKGPPDGENGEEVLV